VNKNIQGGFNLKIKLKNEASLKNVGGNNNAKASDKKTSKIVRSSTKESGHSLIGGNLSVPRANLLTSNPVYH